MGRRGITTVELLVSIGIVAVIIVIALAAIQSSRETARRVHCQNNLRQILMAAHSHHTTHSALPSQPSTFSQPPSQSAANDFRTQLFTTRSLTCWSHRGAGINALISCLKPTRYKCCRQTPAPWRSQTSLISLHLTERCSSSHQPAKQPILRDKCRGRCCATNWPCSHSHCENSLLKIITTMRNRT